LERATGRETQRGPKSAREQAVSRKKPLICQTISSCFEVKSATFAPRTDGRSGEPTRSTGDE
jgi:hypothetical protein